MWYFSWILGTGLACTFAILNAMWLELHEEDSEKALSLGKGYNEAGQGNNTNESLNHPDY